MRALIQRVSRGAVMIGNEQCAQIGPGLVVLLGVGRGDSREDAAYLARKTLNLRIFEDEQGKLNLNLQQINGQLLVVSQFTLYGDCRRGNRPGFDQAAPPELAQELYEYYLSQLREAGITPQTGVFQAHMQVEIVNDGPVTIWLESPLAAAGAN